MSTHKKPLSVAEQKKLISIKTKDFEKRLLASKNDFFTVKILDEIISILQAEVDQWLKMSISEDKDSDTQTPEFLESASLHVAEMNNLIEKINLERTALIKSALQIQQAMINSHQLKSPVIFE